MLVSPVGVLCHLCRTTGETHISSGNLFLRDSDLYPLTGMLIKEMRLHSSDSNRVVKSLLCALLLRVERNLEDEEFITLEQSVRPYEPPSSSDSLMQQVFDHVERHLHHHLSLAGIAASVFVSRAHLSRRFRAALGISVMEYVTRRRIEIACSLLQDPKGIYVSIQDISRVVGFASASYFTQVFTKRMKMSPAAFQKQQRALLQESFFNATEETEREEAEVLAS
jgi:AraC-like DNA-binding protein